MNPQLRWEERKTKIGTVVDISSACYFSTRSLPLFPREDDVTMETGQHVSAEEGKPTTDAKDKRVSEASADTGQAGGGAKESPAGKGAAGGKKGKKNKKKGEEW